MASAAHIHHFGNRVPSNSDGKPRCGSQCSNEPLTRFLPLSQGTEYSTDFFKNIKKTSFALKCP